jgi:hypothetical protein
MTYRRRSDEQTAYTGSTAGSHPEYLVVNRIARTADLALLDPGATCARDLEWLEQEGF